MEPLKVGELARRAGVSIRTLHHYEELGLLQPERSESGHRLYGRASIERLQQVRSLRQLGFSLPRIRELLRAGSVPVERVVADQLSEVREQRERLALLEARLRQLQSLLADGRADDTETVDALLGAIEAMTMYEKHLSPEQQQQVQDLHDAAGDQAAEWQRALDGLRAEMDAGTDPAAPKVQALAERWHAAAAAFLPSGDETAHQSAMRLLHEEPAARRDHGLDDELFAYLGRALAPAEHPEG